MNRRLIIAGTVIATLAGITTLYVSSLRGEQIVWLLVFLISGFFIHKYEEERYFKAGLLLGVIDVLLSIIIHLSLFDLFLVHHKTIQAALINDKQTLSPRLGLAIIELFKGILIILLSGMFGVVVSWIINKIYSKD